MSRSRAQSGFTLIETLIALAIVGLSFAVLFKIISDNLDRTRRARDEAVAASLVQSLLAQTQSGTPRPEVSSGQLVGGYAWRLQVAPYAEAGRQDGSPVEALTITATVSWRDGGETRSRTLTTLRVVPKAAPQ